MITVSFTVREKPGDRIEFKMGFARQDSATPLERRMANAVGHTVNVIAREISIAQDVPIPPEVIDALASEVFLHYLRDDI